MPKFFVPPEQIYDEEALILGADARHIALSLRMQVGDTITVCNSNKRDYDCIISSIEGGIVRAEIISNSICEAEPDLRLRVFQCLPKGDKMDYVVQKSVELGASEIAQVYSQNCIKKPTPPSRDGISKKDERLNRISYEAAEQSGRGIIPVVSECINLERAFELASHDYISFICYEGEKETSLKKFFSEKKNNDIGNKTISFFIGPEGGFSKEEIELAAEYGISAVSLGKRILRTETASSYVLSAISYEFELK